MRKLILILFIIPIYSIAQKSIIVVDNSGIPISNLSIFFESKIVFTTNEKGEFICTADYLNKSLTISEFAYEEISFIPIQIKKNIKLKLKSPITLDEVLIKSNDDYKEVIKNILKLLEDNTTKFHTIQHAKRILSNSKNDTIFYLNEKFKLENKKIVLDKQHKIFNKIKYLKNSNNERMPFIPLEKDTISAPNELCSSSNPESLNFYGNIFKPLKNIKSYKWELYKRDTLLVLKYKPKKSNKDVLSYKGEIYVDNYDYRIYRYQIDAYKPETYLFNSRDYDGKPNEYEFHCNSVSKTYVYANNYGEYKMIFESYAANFKSINTQTNKEINWSTFRGIENVSDFKILKANTLEPSVLGEIKNVN